MAVVSVTGTPGSNFWRGSPRITAEHDFQSRKTFDLGWKTQILMAPTPKEAKRLGRLAPLRPEWESVKRGEMSDVVLRKALSEPEFVTWLLDTGDALLVEYNAWHDNLWGVCICASCTTMRRGEDGENWLGQILMEIRRLIRSYDADPSQGDALEAAVSEVRSP